MDHETVNKKPREYPYMVYAWCNEEDPKENHPETCSKEFAPKQFRESSSKWIKCSDKLPSISKHVLFTNGKYIDIGFRTEIDVLYCVAASMCRSLPTHWQPLPELPKDNELC